MSHDIKDNWYYRLPITGEIWDKRTGYHSCIPEMWLGIQEDFPLFEKFKTLLLPFHRFYIEFYQTVIFVCKEEKGKGNEIPFLSDYEELDKKYKYKKIAEEMFALFSESPLIETLPLPFLFEIYCEEKGLPLPNESYESLLRFFDNPEDNSHFPVKDVFRLIIEEIDIADYAAFFKEKPLSKWLRFNDHGFINRGDVARLYQIQQGKKKYGELFSRDWGVTWDKFLVGFPRYEKYLEKKI